VGAEVSKLVRGAEVEGLLDAVHDRLGQALDVRRDPSRDRNGPSRAHIERYMSLDPQ
jgi:hypothetical protein